MSDTQDEEFGPGRDELLALTPDIYLAGGYLDAAGIPRPELRTAWAMAASTQLADDGVAVQELAFTYEALRSLLPQSEGAASVRAQTTMDDALAVVARLIGQDNNEGLVVWLEDCVAAVRRTEDLDALLAHVLAVLRLYSVTAAFGGDDPSQDGEPDAPSPSGSPS